MDSLQAWLALLLLLVNLLLLVWLLVRRPAANGSNELLASIAAGNDKLEREMRREIGDSARSSRQELATTFATFQQTLVQQSAEAIRTQNTQIDAFAQQLTLLQKTLSDTLSTQLQSLSESNARRMVEVRETLEQQLAQLQQTNAAKLDEMRKTVDEKLQTTLETRLGESFKQVADRLEQVHKGLGEMQSLAVGVGSLQRVLTNVKTRGMFGEVQLEALLEQVLTADQYAKQVETKPRSGQRVDFAIRFPGRGDDGCRLMRNSPVTTTSASWMRMSAWTPPQWNSPASSWRHVFAAKRNRSPRTTWRRRIPPTSPSSFCRSKACMPRYCAGPG